MSGHNMLFDPIRMLMALIINSPELNVRLALVEIVNYLVDGPDEGEETRAVAAEDLLEIAVEVLSDLHHHVGDPEYHSEEQDEHGEHEQRTAPTAEEIERIITGFRSQLNTDDSEEEK